METTLILLKPDCVDNNLCGEVLKRFEKNGFTIQGIKMLQLTDTLLNEHYSHLTHLPFFPEITDFMKSSPVIAVALGAENAVDKARDLLGPTDSAEAPKGTIRGDLGTDKMRNIAHASDSNENAQLELKRFFNDKDVRLW